MIIIKFPVNVQELIKRIRKERGNINYAELMSLDMMPGCDWVVDPRPTQYQELEWRFIFGWSGTNIVLQSIICTIQDEIEIDYDQFSGEWMHFRAYDRAKEGVPDFNALEYTYWGLGGEYAPRNITLGRVHPTVDVIGDNAFQDCRQMIACTMEDNVRDIADHAFHNCVSMQWCRLSTALQVIGWRAFCNCVSIVGLYLPSTMRTIDDSALQHCCNLQFLGLIPQNITDIGSNVILGCDRLLGNSMQYQLDENTGKVINNNQVNLWLVQRTVGLPFHRICQDPRVAPRMIRDFVDFPNHNAALEAVRWDKSGWLPLHILYLNPHMTLSSIEQCVRANPMAMLHHCRVLGTSLALSWIDRDAPNLYFHKICADPQVSPFMIDGFQQRYTHSLLRFAMVGWVPLQILVFNPHATAGSIVACTRINPFAAIVRDSWGRNAIYDILMFRTWNIASALILELVEIREATFTTGREDEAFLRMFRTSM